MYNKVDWPSVTTSNHPLMGNLISSRPIRDERKSAITSVRCNIFLIKSDIFLSQSCRELRNKRAGSIFPIVVILQDRL